MKKVPYSLFCCLFPSAVTTLSCCASSEGYLIWPPWLFASFLQGCSNGIYLAACQTIEYWVNNLLLYDQNVTQESLFHPFKMCYECSFLFGLTGLNVSLSLLAFIICVLLTSLEDTTKGLLPTPYGEETHRTPAGSEQTAGERNTFQYHGEDPGQWGRRKGRFWITIWWGEGEGKVGTRGVLRREGSGLNHFCW